MKGNRKVTMDSLLGNRSEDEEWLLDHGFVQDDTLGSWTLAGRPGCLDFLDDWDIKVIRVTGGKWEARLWYAVGDDKDVPKYRTLPWLTPNLAMMNLVQHLESLRIASWTTPRLQRLLDKYFPVSGGEKDPDLQWLSERGFSPSLIDNDWEKTIGESLVRVSRYPDNRWWARFIGKSGRVDGSPAADPKWALMNLLAITASNGDSPFTEDDE